MGIYTNVKPNYKNVIAVICPENYKIITVFESISYPEDPWDEIIKCEDENKADLKKGEKLYLFHRENDPSGMFYIAKSQNQAYWDFYCAIGTTKLYEEIKKILNKTF